MKAVELERHVGKTWLPRSGSKVNHRNLTSAIIDSRDFQAAKRRAEQTALLPLGPKILVTGGMDFNDHRLIWAKLDQVHKKAPGHGADARQGAEKIASPWATNRNVPQIGFAPDWTKHGRAAPFKRNDEMLEILPKGMMHFPRHRHQRQPRRQGEEARHPGLEVRRRVSAACRQGD